MALLIAFSLFTATSSKQVPLDQSNMINQSLFVIFNSFPFEYYLKSVTIRIYIVFNVNLSTRGKEKLATF